MQLDIIYQGYDFMKIIILFLSLISILVGCTFNVESKLVKSNEDDYLIKDMAKVDDIEGWDINVEDIEFATCYIPLKGETKFDNQPLSKEDIIKVVEAFNAIQKSDINWNSQYIEMDALFEYGPGFEFTLTMKNGDIKHLSMHPLYYLAHNGIYTIPHYQIEYYDAVREICDKNGFAYLDYEYHINAMQWDDNGVLVACEGNIIVNPEKEVNMVFDSVKPLLNEIEGYNKITFNDILKPYMNEIELNDIVETDEMYIKVIEIKEGKITAVAVTLK